MMINFQCLMWIMALLITALPVTGMAVTPQVALGYGHSVALRADGTVAVWGDNAQGQLGLGHTDYRLKPESIPDFSDVSAVAAGREHSLALKSDGTVWAWGANYPNGQLGDGSLKAQTTPVALSEIKNVQAVSAGGWHSLALLTNGQVMAWGRNVSGQLGDGSKVARAKPISISSLNNIYAIAAGDAHSLALQADGRVWAWGDNSMGQLGDGTTQAQTTPQVVPGLNNIIAIAANGQQSVALKSDGTVWAWGQQADRSNLNPTQVSGLTGIVALVAGADFALALSANHQVWAWGKNSHGQLAQVQALASSGPVLIADMEFIVSMGAGGGHGAALQADGSLWTWGWNYSGQLGTGAWGDDSFQAQSLSSDTLNLGSSAIAAPQRIRFGAAPHVLVGESAELNASADSGLAVQFSSRSPTICTVSASTLSALAAGPCLISAQQGGNGHYQAATEVEQTITVGKASQTLRFGPAPLVIVGSQGAIAVQSSAGLTPSLSTLSPQVCALNAQSVQGLSEGVCAIAANQGGDNNYTPATPQKLAFRINKTLFIMPRLAAGAAHSLCLKYEGSVSSWGDNSQGQLGRNGGRTQESISSLKNVTALSAGQYHSLAVLFGGTVHSWGANDKGQLGAGSDTGQRHSPAPVPGLERVRDVAAGGWHSLALGEDGTVWAWGMNNNGQLGDGSRQDRATPMKVAGLSDVKAIAAGYDFSLALKNDGSLWAWGNNANGQLGDGSGRNQSTPVPITSLKNVLTIAAGARFALASSADGQVWAWGDNKQGQLGHGSVDASPVPKAIPKLAKALALSAGTEHALALLEGGILMAWGDNTYGQLGNGSLKASTIPLAVPKLADVIAIAAGDGMSVALKADGSKLSWGNNSLGQLGRRSDTSLESYALPAEVPEPAGWKVWLWLWEQLKTLPDKLKALQKLFADPPLPPLPPLPAMPEASAEFIPAFQNWRTSWDNKCA